MEQVMSVDKRTSQKMCHQFEQAPFVPVFYYDDLDTSIKVLDACIKAGLKVIEYTNRGEAAKANFKAMMDYKNEHHKDVSLGIGSIFDSAQTETFLAFGSDFIVAPIVNERVGRVCQEADILWIPGVGTATELYKAKESGAQLMKLFPGNVLGPGFAKSVLGPMPGLKLMPTGGVEPSRENLTAWFKAGVVTVGMGSQLLDKNLIAAGEYATLQSKFEETIELVNDIKNQL